ncbi:MAG: carbohydrate ABC transporter permease [Roseiflexaceae bacterium]|nr:carbohydrate ABC transporter permease [Roseiflexaceae bacterium]
MAAIPREQPHIRLTSTKSQHQLSQIGTYILLTLGAAIILIPLYWMIATSLKADTKLFVLPPQIIPDPVVWSNYIDVWAIQPFTGYFLNTIFVTLLAMGGEILSCALVAYGFARFRFPGRDAIFILLLSTMMLPGIITMIPSFLIWRSLGRIDTFSPLTVGALFAWGPSYIFLLRQFFMTIPREIEEAAIIDGANVIDIFWKVMLPLVKPALLAIAVLSFNGNWNNFMGPLIYLNTPAKYPVILGLYTLAGSLSQEAPKWNYMMAMTVIMSIPILLLYFRAQKYFIEGLTVGGVKG